MRSDDPNFSEMMRRILKRKEELLARIDEDGLLELTMEDIRSDVSFEAARCADIRGSAVPAHRARRITLTAEDGRTRVLKDRRPRECEACGGDQYLQPCPECGKE